MKLSLVTGTLNRATSLWRLIDSIEKHTSVDWEFIVSDASEAAYQAGNRRVRVLPEKPRLGCTKGYNRAFREACGEFVIWLNDDCEVVKDYDTAAIGFMESHHMIGLGALHYSEPSNGKHEFHVNSAWGATYANFGILRRELGESIGWMDEDLVMYGCDNSLAIRVLMAGHGIADIPDSRVIHHSIQDGHRKDNQQSRDRDNKVLHDKYMPLRKTWLKTFQVHQMDSGAVAWSHGVRPEMAAR